MNSFFLTVDSFLIWFFRTSDVPILGYYIGTAVVCLICVVLGRLTLILGSRINEQFLSRDHKEMVRMHNLSLYALLSKDKGSYRSCNKEANDAFGKVFFSQVGLGASSLWPVPFALAWMQFRFGMVEFPLPVALPGLGESVGFMFTFFPIFVMTYWQYARLCRWWDDRRASSSGSQQVVADDEKLLNLKDLTAPAQSGA